MKLFVGVPAFADGAALFARALGGLEAPAGFMREPVMEHGARVGLRIEPVRAPETGRIYAHRNFVSLQRVGGFGVDGESLSYGLDLALGGAKTASAVVLGAVSEIECAVPRFESRVRALVESGMPVLGAVSEAGAGVMAEIRVHAAVRFVPHADVAGAAAAIDAFINLYGAGA